VRNTSTDLLDEIREVKGITSDYKLAKLLGVRQQTISSYRSGRTQASDEIALRAATIIGRSPGPLLAQLAAERAKNPDVAKVWRDVAKVVVRSRGGGK
jgi:transcriptional regulator with XRE-family HTH domain